MTRIAKLFAILHRPSWLTTLLRFRVAASAEHLDALGGLDCMTVVDVGANKGQFSLLAYSLFPRACIIAFEPLPEPAVRFRRVFRDDANVRLHEMAIGSMTGQATIHVSARDDSSSLLAIGKMQCGIFPGTQETGIKAVAVRRLEDVLRPDEIAAPALLKLDVQGYELEALRGCELLLSNFTWVYCECSFLSLYQGQALADEVITWLRQHGFHLTGVYNVAYARDGKAVQADFLFEYVRRPDK